MSLNIIVAMDPNHVIGKDGGLPWMRIKEDLPLFQKLTDGTSVIMGRNTFESLPEKYKPLPNRKNIVVSNKMGITEGVDICRTLEEAIDKAQNYQNDTFFIGGVGIYEAALPIADKLFISHVKKEYVGNVFFPEIPLSDWQVSETNYFIEFDQKIYIRK